MQNKSFTNSDGSTNWGAIIYAIAQVVLIVYVIRVAEKAKEKEPSKEGSEPKSLEDMDAPIKELKDMERKFRAEKRKAAQEAESKKGSGPEGMPKSERVLNPNRNLRPEDGYSSGSESDSGSDSLMDMVKEPVIFRPPGFDPVPPSVINPARFPDFESTLPVLFYFLLLVASVILCRFPPLVENLVVILQFLN